MKRKLLSVLLSLCIIVSCTAGLALTSGAAEVITVENGWGGKTINVTISETAINSMVVSGVIDNTLQIWAEDTPAMGGNGKIGINTTNGWNEFQFGSTVDWDNGNAIICFENETIDLKTGEFTLSLSELGLTASEIGSFDIYVGANAKTTINSIVINGTELLAQSSGGMNPSEQSKIVINPTVTITGWNIGEYSAETNSPKLTDGSNPGNSTVTYTYSGTGSTTYDTSETVPTAIGTYKVTATIAETTVYAAGECYAEFSITKKPQAAPTGLGKENASSATAADGKITGVNNTMEYIYEGTEDYISITSNVITGLAPGEYFVRYKETESCEPSSPTTITIGSNAQKYKSTSTFTYEYDADLSYIWKAKSPKDFLTVNTSGAKFEITYDHSKDDDGFILLVAKDPAQGWWAEYSYTDICVGADLTLSISVDEFLRLTNVKEPSGVHDIIVRDGWWPQTVSVKSVKYISGNGTDDPGNHYFLPVPHHEENETIKKEDEKTSTPDTVYEIKKVAFEDVTTDSDKRDSLNRIHVTDTSIFNNPAAKLRITYTDTNSNWENLCLGVADTGGGWHQTLFTTENKTNAIFEITVANILNKLGTKADDVEDFQIMGFNGCKIINVELYVPDPSTIEQGVSDINALDISDDISRLQIPDNSILSGSGTLRVNYTAPSDGQIMFGFVLDEAHSWNWKQATRDVHAGKGSIEVKFSALLKEAGVNANDVFSMQVAGLNGVIINSLQLVDHTSEAKKSIKEENVQINKPKDASLNGDVKELAAALLSDKDLVRVAAGEKLTITLNVEDATEKVKSAEKKAIEKEAGDDEIVFWFTASITTEVGNDEEKNVTWTNEDVSITASLPDNAIPSEEGDFLVIRLHEDETSELPAELDGKDLTFINDGFSLFAVAFRASSSLDMASDKDDDTLSENDDEDDDTGSDKDIDDSTDEDSSVQEDANKEETNPNTGVAVGGFAAMIIAGFTAVLTKKKKN